MAGTHGSAGFATEEDMEKAGHLSPGGFLVGVTPKGKRIFTKKEACVHAIAKRGEGKSLTLGANIRYLGSMGCDIVINDPTMEHYHAQWPELERLGYEKRVINLDDIANTDSYNPIAFLFNSSNESYGRDLESLVQLLIPTLSEGVNSTHFLEAAHGLMAAVIDYEYADKMEAASLTECISIITTKPEKERDEYYKQIKNTGSSIAKAGINIYERVGDRERGSFDSTLGRKLRLFHDYSIQGVFECMGEIWTWEDVFINRKPVVVFICGGLGFEEVSGPLCRIIIGQCINSARRYYNKQHRKLLKPLRVFADEADTMGYCKPLQDAVTQLRKVDVNVFACWQSLSQITHHYENAQPFIDGADWIVTGGLKDEKMLGMVSNIMGDYTAQSHSVNEAEHGVSSGLHETPRRLMKIDEIKTLEWGSAIILADRLNIKCKLPFTFENGSVKYL